MNFVFSRSPRGHILRCGMLAVLAAITAFSVPTIQVSAQERLSPGGGSAVAGATDPVLVVTLSSINQLTQDINYISGAVGQPQAGGIFAMMAATFTQGIDTNQPIGIVVPLVDGAPEPIALIPTPDIKVVLKRLEAQTGPADELDDGTLVLAIGANTVFIRQTGSWAVLARNRQVLDAAPADPSGLLSEDAANYDLALRLDMQQIPADTRDALIAQLRQGFDQALSRQQGEQAEATRKMAEGSFEQIEQIIGQTDDLAIGIDIDSLGRQVGLEIEFTALPGTDLAKLYEGQKPIASQFRSVIRDDAAAYFHGAASVGPETVEQARGSIDQIMQMARQAISSEDRLTPDQQEDAANMVERIVDLIVASYAEGKFDAGAVLNTSGGQLEFVFGAFVKDGNEAAKIVQDIADKVKNETDAPRFEFNRDTYNGVTMHMIEADVPASEDEVQKIFGEAVRVHIGTGATTVYVALGDASVPALKRLIDTAATPQPAGDSLLSQLQVKLLPIMQFAQGIENNDVISAMIDALARAADGGKLSVQSEVIDNGTITRVTLGDGLLQAIGAASRQAQAAQMQQGQF
ncbi:MAG: hypothetical protein AAGD07_08600 [Planctomycetota bacterium]